MNCRTFQKNLEDYLENSMDFAGRFGRERHARQCVRCGREMANAQHLSRLVRGLDKVKAPPNFESAVLNEIGERKLRSRFPTIRRFLVFGFDMPSWRQYAFAASVVLVIGFGFLYWRNTEKPVPSQQSVWTDDDGNPPAVGTEGIRFPAMEKPVRLGENNVFGTDDPVDGGFEKGRFADFLTDESEFREYRAIGPDNLPMIVPLPGRIHMQVTPPPEEYFIRNVSH